MMVSRGDAKEGTGDGGVIIVSGTTLFPHVAAGDVQAPNMLVDGDDVGVVTTEDVEEQVDDDDARRCCFSVGNSYGFHCNEARLTIGP